MAEPPAEIADAWARIAPHVFAEDRDPALDDVVDPPKPNGRPREIADPFRLTVLLERRQLDELLDRKRDDENRSDVIRRALNEWLAASPVGVR